MTDAAKTDEPTQMAGGDGRYVVRVQTGTSIAFFVVALIGVAVLAVLPSYVERTTLTLLFELFIYIGVASCWNLLAGYAGLISVGQQAFVGIGAYAAFSVLVPNAFDAGIVNPTWEPILAVLIAPVAAAILAVPIGYIVFRLQGAYFAVITWVVAVILQLLFAKWTALGGGSNRSLGSSVKNEMWGVEQVRELFGEGGSLMRRGEAIGVIMYWMALAAAVIVVVGCYIMIRRRTGLGLAAVKDSEPAAESVGVGLNRTKFSAYLFAAFGAGLLGAVYFLNLGNIAPPQTFDVIRWTAYIIFIVVIGGIGTIEGPIIGAVVFVFLQDYFSGYNTWYLIGLGAFAIFMMLFFPKGIWGTIAARYNFYLFPTRRRLVLSRRNREPETTAPATTAISTGS